MPNSRPDAPRLRTDDPETAAGAAPGLRLKWASRTGELTLLLGCMFSGKTTRLLEALGGLPPAERRLFKHRIDRRYAEDAVVTHAGVRMDALSVADSGDIARRLPPRLALLAIDEAHFFDSRLSLVIGDVLKCGVDVLMTGLDRNSWGRTIAVIEALRPLAARVEVLTAVCGQCGGEARRTQRIAPIVGGVLVGGPESYDARCDSCWTPPPEPPPVE